MTAYEAARRPRPQAPTPPPAAKFGDGPGSRQQAATVFIVDDDESVRDSLSVLLESLGFEVMTHASGREVLADDRCRTADCLIVDQHMPGMDGLTTLAALQGAGAAVPAILITGRLDPEIATRAAQLGVSAVLEKPFAATKLLELVRASTKPE